MLKSFSVRFEDLVLGEKVGEGSFGTVYKGRYGGAIVAIKQLRVNQINRSLVRAFKSEIRASQPALPSPLSPTTRLQPSRTHLSKTERLGDLP